MPKHAVFFEIDDQAAIVQDERLEYPRIVVLRKPAEIRIAAEVVQKIRADRTACNIESVVRARFQRLDNRIL